MWVGGGCFDWKGTKNPTVQQRSVPAAAAAVDALQGACCCCCKLQHHHLPKVAGLTCMLLLLLHADVCCTHSMAGRIWSVGYQSWFCRNIIIQLQTPLSSSSVVGMFLGLPFEHHTKLRHCILGVLPHKFAVLHLLWCRGFRNGQLCVGGGHVIPVWHACVWCRRVRSVLPELDRFVLVCQLQEHRYVCGRHAVPCCAVLWCG